MSSTATYVLGRLKGVRLLSGSQDLPSWIEACQDYPEQQQRAAIRALIDQGPSGPVTPKTWRAWLTSRQDWLLPPEHEPDRKGGQEPRRGSEGMSTLGQAVKETQRRISRGSVASEGSAETSLVRMCWAALKMVDRHQGSHPMFPGRCVYCAQPPKGGHLEQCPVPWLARLTGKQRRVRG